MTEDILLRAIFMVCCFTAVITVATVSYVIGLDRRISAVVHTQRLLTTLFEGVKGDIMNLTQLIEDLRAKVQANTNATTAAIALINGIPALIEAAVTKALEAGATPEQLASLTALKDEIAANADNLGAAVTAGTPAA